MIYTEYLTNKNTPPVKRCIFLMIEYKLIYFFVQLDIFSVIFEDIFEKFLFN